MDKIKKIQLTQGKEAFVDEEIFEKVNSFKWYAAKRKHTFYAARSYHDSKGIKRQIYMHRFIMDVSDKEILIDHVDGNGLNNTKSNLRKSDRIQNARNAKGTKNNTSKYKGVYFNKKAKKWTAMISVNYKSIYLGLFTNEKEAAKKYDSIAKEKFGEFAKLNFN